MQLAVLEHLPSSIERCFAKQIWSVRVFDARRGSSNALCGEPNCLFRGLRSVWCIGTLVMVLLLSGVASAAANPPSASYFVSTSGSDSNNGSSPATPWQTLAKLNATRLAPEAPFTCNAGASSARRLKSDLRARLPRQSVMTPTAPAQVRTLRGSAGPTASPPGAPSKRAVSPSTLLRNQMRQRKYSKTTTVWPLRPRSPQ